MLQGNRLLTAPPLSLLGHAQPPFVAQPPASHHTWATCSGLIEQICRDLAMTISALTSAQRPSSSGFAGPLDAAVKSLFLPEPFWWPWLIGGACLSGCCEAPARGSTLLAVGLHVVGGTAARLSGGGTRELLLQISGLQSIS